MGRAMRGGTPSPVAALKFSRKKSAYLKYRRKDRLTATESPADQFGPFLAPVPLLQEAEAIAGQDGGQHKKDVFRLAPGIEIRLASRSTAFRKRAG